VLWIGFAVLAVAVLGGESIAARLGWKYPDWLRPPERPDSNCHRHTVHHLRTERCATGGQEMKS